MLTVFAWSSCVADVIAALTTQNVELVFTIFHYDENNLNSSKEWAVVAGTVP
jgi:hypothetical protein